MSNFKLFMMLVGCKPKGRHTEQHDIFFTIAENLKSTIPAIKAFWPDSGSIHIDAWREVTEVDGHKINVLPRASKKKKTASTAKLFFLNLGGYKKNEFEEYHYKMIVPAENKSAAIAQAKETAFYKHTGFKGASSHIDDKYGIDVDDLYLIEDLLPKEIKQAFQIEIIKGKTSTIDQWHIGYTNLSKIK